MPGWIQWTLLPIGCSSGASSSTSTIDPELVALLAPLSEVPEAARANRIHRERSGMDGEVEMEATRARAWLDGLRCHLAHERAEVVELSGPTLEDRGTWWVRRCWDDPTEHGHRPDADNVWMVGVRQGESVRTVVRVRWSTQNGALDCPI